MFQATFCRLQNCGSLPVTDSFFGQLYPCDVYVRSREINSKELAALAARLGATAENIQLWSGYRYPRLASFEGRVVLRCQQYFQMTRCLAKRLFEILFQRGKSMTD